MNQSLYKDLAEKYLESVVAKVAEEEENNPVLLSKKMLTEEYSPDLNWGSEAFAGSVVAADVISLDSSLPLKSHNAGEAATGKLPKLGLKYRKLESDISALNLMLAKDTDEATIASRLLDDAVRAVKAVNVRNEIMFRQGLSSGAITVQNNDTHGTGVKVFFTDQETALYGNDGNGIVIEKKWDQTGATPLSDLQKQFDMVSAAGGVAGHVFMDRRTFNALRSSGEGKALGAAFLGSTSALKDLPTPARASFIEALEDEFGAVFHIIENNLQYEALDGAHKVAQAWTPGRVVFTPSDHVGRLVYGTLVEETNPVEGVSYAKAGNFTLVSKYSYNDPLEEYTAAQALCLPVIDGYSHIYTVQALTVTPLS